MKYAIYALANFICTVINVVGWILNYKIGEYGWATVNACLAGSCFVVMIWDIREALDD